MRMTVPFLLATLGLALCLPAQDYSEQVLEAQRVRFEVFHKLAAVPLQIGAEEPNLSAKFEPDNEGDYIWGKYGKFAWQLYCFEFQGTKAAEEGPATGEADGDSETPKSKEQAEKEMREEFRKRSSATTFAEWVKEKDRSSSGGKRRYVVNGKANKGTGKRPPFAWWEYTDRQDMVSGAGAFEQVWHKTAAVYTLPDGREIALVVVLPAKGDTDKPDTKWVPVIKRMLTSLSYLGEAEVTEGADEPRDKYAETEEQKAALATLKKNIGDLDNWDYFTTPDFILTYSWNSGKNEQRADMRKFTRWVAVKLEDARAMFRQRYPPHEKMEKNYSIVRVCHDYDEFSKYGNTPPGVVGWFSPGSKELVIYYDKEKIFARNEDEMLAVAYHEAWHQYSDQYWPDVELCRWFDEGLAEYFGSLRKKGKGEDYVFHKGRVESLREQMSSKTLIPSATIVAWDRSTFYGARAADHYAQAWAMVDFLMRGKSKLGARWNARWSEILPIYSKVCLEQKAPKKAIEAAFEGVDIEAYEAAWLEWVKGGNIKKK